MNGLWWLALPILLLPLWWHRQKREQTRTVPLASARFLPHADPRQMRVWRWSDPLLLLVRCLLLACAIAWLADPVVAWRGDTVLVAAGTDAAWAEQQIGEAGFGGARRLAVPAADALGWLRTHEREWKNDARLLVVGKLAMPAALPQFRHRVALRPQVAPLPKTEHRIAIVGARAREWRKLFAAAGGPRRFVVQDAPNGETDLVIWSGPDAPPPGLRAPLWWVVDPAAFPELRSAREVDGVRYADSARGRLWTSATWPPKDADSARAVFETWQRLHYPPVAFTAPQQVIDAGSTARTDEASGALRDVLMMALVALFALERMLTHASRR